MRCWRCAGNDLRIVARKRGGDWDLEIKCIDCGAVMRDSFWEVQVGVQNLVTKWYDKAFLLRGDVDRPCPCCEGTGKVKKGEK